MDLALSFGMPLSKFKMCIECTPITFFSSFFFVRLCLSFSPAISFGLLKSYDMPCNVESASLEPTHGKTFIAGGEDMWVHRFDFQTGEEIGKFLEETWLIGFHFRNLWVSF